MNIISADDAVVAGFVVLRDFVIVIISVIISVIIDRDRTGAVKENKKLKDKDRAQKIPRHIYSFFA